MPYPCKFCYFRNCRDSRKLNIIVLLFAVRICVPSSVLSKYPEHSDFIAFNTCPFSCELPDGKTQRCLLLEPLQGTTQNGRRCVSPASSESEWQKPSAGGACAEGLHWLVTERPEVTGFVGTVDPGPERRHRSLLCLFRVSFSFSVSFILKHLFPSASAAVPCPSCPLCLPRVGVARGQSSDHFSGCSFPG